MGSTDIVLDLGCGTGAISEYLSDCTGAHIIGLDYAPQAIRQAKERTAAKATRLTFVDGDINHLQIPQHSFDVIISIDTMYFSEDYTATIGLLKQALQPGGQMAILFSHGWEPWAPKEDFPKETLAPDKTPLARALQANGLPFKTWDLTQQDYALAQRRKQVLTELKPQFEAEGTLFIYENRMGDAVGVSQAVQDALHARYLYHVQLARSN